jgi:hypothetical protein
MGDLPTLESIFPNADLTFSLKEHYDTHSLIEKATQYIKLIPNYQKLRLDPQLTLLILNIIQNEIKQKDFDHIALLIQILTPLFGLNDFDINIIKQQIAFLKNNSHIIGIPYSKKAFKSASRWIFRKIG